MIKFGRHCLWGIGLCSFAAGSLMAAEGQDAGAILHSSSPKPYAEITPQKNFTSFMDYGKKNESENDEQEIYFSADEMENDQERSIITAKGNVNIVRDNLTLIADKVIYNQNEDVVVAVGSVVLLEESGNVVFSDYVELKDKMNVGEMHNIKVIMKDKTRLAAAKGRKYADDRKMLQKVVYTPCDVCSEKESPLWQIKASKVRHDVKNQNINYNDARLEVKGIPVLYTPFFSHPDPSVKRRSGFLTPRFSSNSYLGATLQPQYFWAISDQQDVLFSPILTTDKGIVWNGDYNGYLYRGDMNISGSYMRDPDDDRHRGNLFMKGRYEVNDFWLANMDINYASDRTYLKDLSLPKQDDAWLVSSLKMQGFDNRNYSSVESYYYKLISNDLKDYGAPYVLPLFDYENIGEVQKYGAYSKLNLNFASVYRDEDDDSATQRMTMINSWNLPYTSPYGEKYKLVASVKSDLYYVDNYQNPDGETYDGVTGRIFPQLGLEWRMPFVKATESSRHILEPVVVAVAAPNSRNYVDKIPNEDSQDVELDDTNILDLDRYAGYDRNDTSSRISYGVNWNAYGDIYGRTAMFFAQSYKFNKNESFTEAEGGDGNFSDYVGRIYASPNEYFDLNYRFRLDKNDYELTYSELSTRFGPRILNAYISYIYLKDNENSSLIENSERKELYTGLNAALSRDWSINIYNRQDLTRGGGSLEYGGNLVYEDECLKFFILMRRDNSNDPEYQGDFEVSFNFLLKTLGAAGSGK